MTLKPELFGLRDAAHAVRVSFLTVAVWWAVFSIPILLFVKEEGGGGSAGWSAVTAGLRQLKKTFAKVRQLRVLFLFLLGYWFYIDGVYTITRMAVDYGLSIGLPANSLIVALLITQFVGFPAAIVFGKLGEKIGPKTGIYIGIAVYIAACIWSYFMDSVSEFYGLAITIGLVLGGVQSLSRSFYARLIPRDKSAEFFGFYNMLGKFSAVIGPVMMGWVGVLTGSPRYAVLSVAVLFVIGWLFLIRVDETKGRRAAKELETN
jgi:UMF1 family MFS transporter